MQVRLLEQALPLLEVELGLAPGHVRRRVAQGRAVLAVELEPAAEFLFGQVLVIDRIRSMGLFHTSASREKADLACGRKDIFGEGLQ